jgi:HSP20 family molecular chaperone IbpA
MYLGFEYGLAVFSERLTVSCLANPGSARDQKKKFHRIERSFGTFRRSFTLPEDADSTKVTAEFRDGVLKVHLPTTPVAKSKATQIKVR